MATILHKKYKLYFVFIGFGLIFCLISLVNHYNFRTFAFDLGIYNNALFDYAHLSWNDNSIMQYQNLLSDHFTLLQLLYAPLYWIFGSYTLLLIQIAAILFGAWGAYRYQLLRTQDSKLSFILLIQFLSIWGIYSALAFDYHDNVVAAMLVPWFFYYFHQQKWQQTALFFALIIISKENMALWGIFLGLGLALQYFRKKPQLIAALILAGVATVYFLVVLKIIVPSLTVGEREYLYTSRYVILGSNMTEIIQNCFTRPFYVLGLLFKNHLADPNGDWIKMELHTMLLVSGGFAFLFRPAYLFMLIPIFAQKVFSDNFMHWGLNYQYSIEFVPIINIALTEMLTKQPVRYKLVIARTALILTLIATGRSFEHRISKWFEKSTIQFYKARHYKRHFNVTKAHQALKLIPAEAPVSAISALVPHLALREHIFQYPFVGDAQYIALIQEENPYPMTAEEYKTNIQNLSTSPHWKKIYDEDFILIFEKLPSAPPAEPIIYK